MFVRIACSLATVPLFAAVAQADPPKGPADLQGAWRLMSVEAEAGSVGLPEPRPELLIKGDRLLYGGEEIARISTDAATRPRVLDLRFANPKRVFEGVYTVQDDSLKVCLNGSTEGVKERPQSFSLEGHPTWRLLTFERGKAGKAEAASGFIGLALRFDDERREVIVNEVLEGGPAKKAGLRKDDVLLGAGAVAVTDLASAVGALRRAKPRSDLVLRVRRDGKEREVKVQVGLLPFTVLAGLE
jgi:uncharacterized protein (TIGR03067 family)